MAEGTIEKVEEEVETVARGELGHALEPAPGLLPGEVRPHPTPFKYVMIAVVLVVITAVEIAVSYLEGDIPNSLIIVLLMIMMIVKFAAVASWYMHLRTDKPIFQRFFILGVTAPIVLYAIVLASLHSFG
jgi:caa(3)-type oxidase subunit IV